MWYIPKITPFVRSFFENATADIDKIFKKELNKSSHNTHNQSTRGFIKKCKFYSSLHPQGKCPAYGKVCPVCNKKNHFKVSCPHVGKKVYTCH